MKHCHRTMPSSTLSLTRSLQAGACALAQLLLLVFTPWLHAHPDEGHGATAGHAYHLHTMAAASGRGNAGFETAPHRAAGVAFIPIEAFAHLLAAATPLVAPRPSSPEAKNRLAAGDLPFPAGAGGGPPEASLSPVSFPRLSPCPEPGLPSGRRILLLGTDLPPPAV
jgi:hypothetical protein